MASDADLHAAGERLLLETNPSRPAPAAGIAVLPGVLEHELCVHEFARTYRRLPVLQLDFLEYDLADNRPVRPGICLSGARRRNPAIPPDN